jgi:hypothetical protein
MFSSSRSLVHVSETYSELGLFLPLCIGTYAFKIKCNIIHISNSCKLIVVDIRL